MSLLSNGLELLELGVTAWREIVNTNFSKLYTKTETDALITTVNTSIDALKDVAANAQSSAYTMALTDRGKSIDTSANVTIPLNSAVAFPIGSVVTITSLTPATINILATSGVTIRLAGTSTSGDCTVASYGIATLRKVAADTWYIAGAGVALVA